VGAVAVGGDPVGPLGPDRRVVRDLLAGLLGTDLAGYPAVRPVKPPRVYRWPLPRGAPTRSVILKRLDPDVARRTRAVAERWLPALGLEGAAARLLGSVEGAEGGVWHVYEDLGDVTLASDPRPADVQRTIDLVARLHTGAAEHALLSEARDTCHSLGIGYFEDNVAAALQAVRQLLDSEHATTAADARLVDRLHHRLDALLGELDRRRDAFIDLGWPETLLHGDVWPINVSVRGSDVRLLDWDKAGVGPATYDVSAFLMRLPRDERPTVLERYLRAVGDAGWPLPALERLEVALDTNERARYANRVIWPALALVEGPSGWEFPELAEVERWFEALDASAPMVAER
jgi:thiamine kinase-like enzyme